jgi:hypothetical protein
MLHGRHRDVFGPTRDRRYRPRAAPLAVRVAHAAGPQGAVSAGPGDYLVKPFSLQELQARTRALPRRARMRDAARRLRIGDVVLDAGGADCHARRVRTAAQAGMAAPDRLAELLLKGAAYGPSLDGLLT